MDAVGREREHHADAIGAAGSGLVDGRVDASLLQGHGHRRTGDAAADQECLSDAGHFSSPPVAGDAWLEWNAAQGSAQPDSDRVTFSMNCRMNSASAATMASLYSSSTRKIGCMPLAVVRSMVWRTPSHSA